MNLGWKTAFRHCMRIERIERFRVDLYLIGWQNGMPETLKKSQDCAFVVVAAGRGERAGARHEGPKQYRKVGGQPVIRRTLETILSWHRTGTIVAVIHADDHTLFENAVAGLAGRERIVTVNGGATRQNSVLCGLDYLANEQPAYVFIHDAVRPFIDHGFLDGIAALLDHGANAALPATPVPDTLKKVEAGLVTGTVDRSSLYAAQTPQAFSFAPILAAHRKAALSSEQSFTDDASIAEWAGIGVRLAEGLPGNIKLTVKRDIELADERYSKTMVPDVRCGNGYDVHQLVPGNGVTLCGIFVEHEKSLSGHSDADVALHALTDALLATCGAGDIGDHFPPSDPQWKGAASRIFLEKAAQIVRDHGGTITNADVSIIAERPKVGPHRDSMRANLANILGIALDRCSVKATTNEKIGFAGREEGIAAIATATVVYEGKSA
jgi:2-C-methyl-D-erythritol 4-phosphate cytidylyltransferase / 2-C-methyl-D-erythritol 2,4-cyclodiphosphate synthase